LRDDYDIAKNINENILGTGSAEFTKENTFGFKSPKKLVLD
jgi:hypothetical protein